MPEPEEIPFDFNAVCSVAELERQKRLALQLSGTGRKFAEAIDGMIARKKEHDRKQQVLQRRTIKV